MSGKKPSTKAMTKSATRAVCKSVLGKRHLSKEAVRIYRNGTHAYAKRLLTNLAVVTRTSGQPTAMIKHYEIAKATAGEA